MGERASTQLIAPNQPSAPGKADGHPDSPGLKGQPREEDMEMWEQHPWTNSTAFRVWMQMLV